MKPLVLAVLVGCVVWLVQPLAAAATEKFDGKWTATNEPIIGRNCPLAGQVIRYDFTVRKGQVDGTIKAGFGVHKLTGVIEPDGSINDFKMVGLIPWSFTGKFGTDRAEGKFQGRTCGGNFLFLRKNGN